jgi:hypothetical protein
LPLDRGPERAHNPARVVWIVGQQKIDELQERGIWLSMLPSPSAGFLREILLSSRDRVVAVYAVAEQLVPIPFTLPADIMNR